MTNTTQFLKRLKDVRLSDNERLRMREHISLYADEHAVHGDTEEFSYDQPFFLLAFFSNKRFSTYVGALLIVATFGGTVTLAAEGAVPGTVFYPVKIHVNEPVMTALAPTEEGQARVASRLATRRADEVVKLALEGKLTDEHEAYLTKAFDTQIEKATAKADKLAQSGDSTASAQVKEELTTQLAGEAQALGAVRSTGGTQDKGAERFLSVIIARSESISGVPEFFEGENTDEEEPRTALLKTTARSKSASTTKAKTEKLDEKHIQKTVFPKRLQVTASTTLRVRLEGTALQLPKTDSALNYHQETHEDEEHLNANFNELLR
ncbi:MAG: DUF5667 domain-containing protein [Patescibacteria group bacterium]